MSKLVVLLGATIAKIANPMPKIASQLIAPFRRKEHTQSCSDRNTGAEDAKRGKHDFHRGALWFETEPLEQRIHAAIISCARLTLSVSD